MRFIGFKLSATDYAFPILNVQEIMNVPLIKHLPQSPDYFEGISNLRGRIVPIVNLGRLLGLPENIEQKEQKIIVVRSGRAVFGTLVDSITGVINIEPSQIEAVTQMDLKSGAMEGIAKLDDRMVILVDIKNLIPMDDMSIYEDDIIEVNTIGDRVEIVKEVESLGGRMLVREHMDAEEYLKKRGITAEDPRYALIGDIKLFLEAMGEYDLEKAEAAMNDIMRKGKGNLYAHVGRLARILHDDLKSLRTTVDVKLKEVATIEMPSAVNKLHFVIDRTEEANDRTVRIAEHYLNEINTLGEHTGKITGPAEAVRYLAGFRTNVSKDFTDILAIQSSQDMTNQTVKKVIKLVEEIEAELAILVATFGVDVRIDKTATEAAENVSQADIDALLKEFDF